MFTEAMPFITHCVSELANELHQRRPEYRPPLTHESTEPHILAFNRHP
jgi:hypothetical protein